VTLACGGFTVYHSSQTAHNRDVFVIPFYRWENKSRGICSKITEIVRWQKLTWDTNESEFKTWALCNIRMIFIWDESKCTHKVNNPLGAGCWVS
jgi:hypothetical protein